MPCRCKSLSEPRSLVTAVEEIGYNAKAISWREAIQVSNNLLTMRDNVMDARITRLCRGLLISLLLAAPIIARAGEPAPTLSVRESGVALYARQDSETERIASLERDEVLFPIAESVGGEIWYMVRTKQGLVGWVRGVDVVASSQTKDAFKEKESSSSTWAARTGEGKTFNGTWSIAPDSSSKSASGAWTLSGAEGVTVMRGTWSAEKHATGWNGIWRASVEGRQGEYTGSWSSEISHIRNARFAELFEAAAKEAVRGLWTGANQSGSWSIRAGK